MKKCNKAFTMVELIVVIAIVSTLLFFAAPRMDGFLLVDNSRKVSNWIIFNVAGLKEKSIQEQKRFFLYADIDNGLFWIGDETMGDKALAEKRKNGFELPRGHHLTSVLFPGDKRVLSGTVALCFYPEGYSDRAIIQIQDGQNQKSYVIEAFLPRVDIRDEHTGF